MNERRRFLQVVGSSVMAAGAGCAAPQPLGTGGTGGPGAGGASGTGGGGGATSTTATTASGTTATGGTTATTASSSSGGKCGAGGAANEGANNDVCQSNKGRFDVGKPADYAAMGFHKVTNVSAGILMLRDAGGLHTLSSWCSHQCCDMNDTSPQGDYGSPTTVSGKPAWRCNCHGSKFLADGTVGKGPAPTGLEAFELSLGCDGILYVDTGKVVPHTMRLMA